MAKAKSSRRTRRQEAEKQRQSTDSIPVVDVTPTEVESPSVEADSSFAPPRGKSVDFAQEYFYVRGDLRNMVIVSAVLFVIMVGLLYVI